MREDGNRFSSKTLGELAMPSFCPRCFWIRMKLGNRVPFRTPPPGIFSSIDSYTKRYIEKLLDLGRLANLIPELSNASKIVKAVLPEMRHDYPGGTAFLTGVPDAIFSNLDSSFTIADYKTARFTEAQRSMLPLYEVQVRAYAVLARSSGLKPLNALLLIYLEPLTGDESLSVELDAHPGHSGEISIRLQPFVHSIKQNEYEVFQLLEKADRLLQLPDPPDPNPYCQNCKEIDRLKNLFR